MFKSEIMKKHITIFSLGILSLLVASCGEPDYPQPVPSVSSQTSKLLVVHTYMGAPRLKVKVDNRVSDKDTVRFEKAPDGKFYNNITLAVPAGPNRLISIADLDNNNLVTDRYTAASSTNNTSFITYSVVNNVPVTSVVRVADDLVAPDPGFAKVRFFNFSPDAGEVKLTVTELANTTTVFSARKFKETSRKAGSVTTEFNRFSLVAIRDYPQVTSQTVTYEVRSTTNDEVLLTIPSLKLDSKSIYTIYLKGSLTGEGDNALSYAVIKH
jgi:hypothetical protein